MAATQQLLVALKVGVTPPAVVQANVVSAENSTPAGTLTQAVDCTGANYLIVDIIAVAVGAFTSITATYNGSAMTELISVEPVATVVFFKRFCIKAPTTGTNNVVITYAGSNYAFTAIGSVPMSGVNQTTSEGTSGSAQGSSSTPSVTITSAVNELVIGFVWAVGGTISANGTGQTTLYTQNQTGLGDQIRATSEAGAASVVTDWTLGAAGTWIVGGTPVKPL